MADKDFEISNRFMYQYNREKEGEYEILLPEKNLEKYYVLGSEFFIQFDNTIEKEKLSKNEDGYYSLGKKTFTKGKHEIGFNLPKAINLIQDQSEFTIFAENDGRKDEKQFSIKDFDPYSSYLVNLDYYVRAGAAPIVSLLQNNDLIRDGIIKATVDRTRELYWDLYWFDYRNDSFIFTPDPTADEAVLKIEPQIWNNCLIVFKENPKKCLDLSLKKRFDRTSEVKIKNLQVTKAFINDPILKMIHQTAEKQLPSVTITRIDQTKYEVNIKNATEPFLLVFSELFNNEWRASFKDNSKTYIKDHYLVNGYANSWVIDKKGDSDLILEFYPQRMLIIGFVISGIGISIAALGLLVLILKKKQ
jgi:hypothetical protein